VARGATSPVRTLTLVGRYGPGSYAAISGSMVIWVVIASSIAPVMAGLLFDTFGGYGQLLVVVGVTSLAAAACFAALARYSPLA
jgi:uncharacterized membrane protein